MSRTTTTNPNSARSQQKITLFMKDPVTSRVIWKIDTQAAQGQRLTRFDVGRDTADGTMEAEHTYENEVESEAENGDDEVEIKSEEDDVESVEIKQEQE
jgi:hypothetical protein